MKRWAAAFLILALPVAIALIAAADAQTGRSAPPVPAYSVAGQGRNLKATAAGPAGYLHTEGNGIVDSAGRLVRLTGVNWYGLENTNFAPEGLWARNYRATIEQMAELGFNTIRLPFALELLEPSSIARSINATFNHDLVGLSGIEVMDRVIDHAGRIGLRVILDNHRGEAGVGADPSGLWFGGRYSEADWIARWQILARRYAGNTTVIGADLRNEPHDPANWGEGGAYDWRAAATRAGNAIHEVNANWLIFVEGVQTWRGQKTWWGGNLMGVATHPVQLRVPNRVVYSPHDYPGSVQPQPWLVAREYPATLAPLWHRTWGYIYAQEIAPVFVGEFGAKLKSDADRLWFTHIVAYMNGKSRGNGRDDGMSWAYWAWNPTSSDTEGLVLHDWTTINSAKIEALQPAMARDTALAAVR